MKVSLNFFKSKILGFIILLSVLLFLTTFLNQVKYYSQLSESRQYHYQDVIIILKHMNQQCLKENTEKVCYEQFINVLQNYSNRGTIRLYTNASSHPTFEKRDESIYDHRLPVLVSHTFDEFTTLQPHLEISKLTSYPNLSLSVLNAMTFSSADYLKDAMSRLSGNGPTIINKTWWEFAKDIAWNRFYPSLPFVAIMILILAYGGWQKRKVEKENIKLIKAHVKLNQEKNELDFSIEQLSRQLDDKEHEKRLLSDSISILQVKINNSVDKKVVEELKEEKNFLDHKLFLTLSEKDNVLKQLEKKESDKQILLHKFQEYEAKAGYTLVGEFIRRWSILEYQLYRLSSPKVRMEAQEKAIDKSKKQSIAAQILIEDLYNQAIINEQNHEQLSKIRQFRNRLVHASSHNTPDPSYQNISHDLKQYIQVLDKTLEKLEKQEVYYSAA